MTITVSRKVLYVLGGVLVVVLAGVLGAAIAGGGSKTETTTVVETVSSDGSDQPDDGAQEAEDAVAASASDDCDSMGINRAVGREGTCTDDGVQLVVIDKESVLKLNELNLRLLDIETTKTVSDEFGTTKSANGIYAIFALEVVNKTNSPVYFDSSQEQALLYLGDNEYTEDFEVENYALDDSFVSKFETIQPDTSMTGSIAFDIPPKLVHDLGNGGNLAILNFSDEGEAGAAKQIGIVRTYK